MGNEQQNEGKLEQVRGNIKEGIGEALGNEKMQREGQWDQVKGHVREDVGDLRQGIDETADELKRSGTRTTGTART